MPVEYQKPLPYYRWWVRDHRAHRIGRTLNCFEEGMLRRLLDEQWEKGAIPDDPAALAEIVGESVGVVAQAWQKLSKFFEPLEGMDGMFVQNRRLEFERTEADTLRAKRRVAGAKGGKAKQALANASKSLTGELGLEFTGPKVLQSNDLGQNGVANSSKVWQPSQESSSREEKEKSRRESLAGRCVCGGEDGFHRPNCPIARLLAHDHPASQELAS